MTLKLSETRVAALIAARSGRLWRVGSAWRKRGGHKAFGERTIGPLVRAGLLADVCGTRDITAAGRARLAELERAP